MITISFSLISCNGCCNCKVIKESQKALLTLAYLRGTGKSTDWSSFDGELSP